MEHLWFNLFGLLGITTRGLLGRSITATGVAIVLIAGLTANTILAGDRPRLAVLTDIGGDPDDQQSLIRLMIYSNEFEIEALVASAVRANHAKDGPTTRPQLIREIVDAYGRVLPNLQKHASDWPTVEAMRASIHSGNPNYGRAYIGDGHDTTTSRFLIERIDAGTADRPLNIAVWGGQTDLAQALWRVKHDRSDVGFREFAKNFRVYDIDDQDGIAEWMRAEFPGMFYILAKAATGAGNRTGVFRGMYLGGDESLTSREWVERNVCSTGPLGALYPMKTSTMPNRYGCMKEGDSPSWFFFLPIGGNDPNDPTKPGWGGQFVRQPDGWYRDVLPKPGFAPIEAVNRWRTDFQKDFARRIAWCHVDSTK